MLTSRRLWFGTAVTAVFLSLLFLRFDFTEMRGALAEANYLYLIPAVGIYFVSLYARTFRWRFLLLPFVETETKRLYPVVLVGYMANNVLPVRLGEFARSYYLSTREPVRGSTALATIIIERVFDGLTLLFFLAVATLFLPVPGLADRVRESVTLPLGVVAVIVIVPFVGLLALMVLAAVYSPVFLGLARKFTKWLPERAGERAFGLITWFIAGFEGLQRPRRLMMVFLLTLPIWAVEGTVYYFVALAFDLDSEFDNVGIMIAAMLVVTSFSNLASSIPSSQGSVGPFELFAALALVSLGVSSGVASAYAVVLHLTLLLPVIAAGLAHLAYRSVSLRELARGVPSGASEDSP